MRAGVPAIVVACVIAALARSPGAAAADRPDRAHAADSLRLLAAEHVTRGTLDERRMALMELEEASRLAPGDHRVWLDLGRLCLERGERARGRECYDRAGRVAPQAPEAFALLGSAWTWEWLSSFEGSALARAEQNLVRAAKLDPQDAGNWARLSALSLSRGRLDPALRAALDGLAADPEAWEPAVALACAAWRRGEPSLADSMFRVARARVPRSEREHFAAAPWTVDDREGPRSDRLADPDLTTPENEAELDYLTRLGLALLLFRDVRGLHWDMRTELFARYGPPASVLIDPVTSPLAHWDRRLAPSPSFAYSPEPMFYPYNVQAWAYPELGMWVELWDRALNQTFELPQNTEDYVDPRPNPALLAMRPEVVTFGEGRGVFRAMAPGTRPVPAEGQVARFPTREGTLLLAHVVTAGEPTDSLSGAWAVVAPDGHVLARASSPLASSSCDPSGKRVAEFSTVVPPGDYRVDLTVSGGARRGIVRLAAEVPPPDTALHLSDLVMLCSLAGAEVAPGTVRIEPDMERRFSGSGALSIYFEIDRLTPGSDGRSRFAYTYALRPVAKEGKKRRAAVAFEASREESHDGAHRRQFVTIPMRGIKSGTYDLAIEVRDLVAGTRATGELRFQRE